jgi:hypothetical protein
MKPGKSELTKSFLKESRHSIAGYHMPRLIKCLKLLSAKDGGLNGSMQHLL